MLHRNTFGAPSATITQRHHWLPGKAHWTEETGAHSVQGEIRKLWERLGWENGLGYPTTDELPTDADRGRYNEFTGDDNPPATAYWTPVTGVHYVDGPILERWSELGRETSYLGYPTSDPRPNTGGWTVNFQGDSSRWTATPEKSPMSLTGGE